MLPAHCPSRADVREEVRPESEQAFQWDACSGGYRHWLSLGAAVAYFLKVLIDNTPAEIDLRRLRLFYLMVITSGGLGGFAIEATRQLQEEATDPLYRQKNPYRGRRPL